MKLLAWRAMEEASQRAPERWRASISICQRHSRVGSVRTRALSGSIARGPLVCSRASAWSSNAVDTLPRSTERWTVANRDIEVLSGTGERPVCRGANVESHHERDIGRLVVTGPLILLLEGVDLVHLAPSVNPHHGIAIPQGTSPGPPTAERRTGRSARSGPPERVRPASMAVAPTILRQTGVGAAGSWVLDSSPTEGMSRSR